MTIMLKDIFPSPQPVFSKISVGTFLKEIYAKQLCCIVHAGSHKLIVTCVGREGCIYEPVPINNFYDITRDEVYRLFGTLDNWEILTSHGEILAELQKLLYNRH